MIPIGKIKFEEKLVSMIKAIKKALIRLKVMSDTVRVVREDRGFAPVNREIINHHAVVSRKQ